MFGGLAVINGFEYLHGGWFKETPVCIITLDLQRSNYSNLYYLNIKFYIHKILGNNYTKSKELLRDIGNVFRRQPTEYNEAFDLDNNLSDDERKIILGQLFTKILVPMVKELESKEKMKNYITKEGFYLAPLVRKFFGID